MAEERAMLTMAEPEMLQILSSPELVMTKSGRLIHLKSVACRWATDPSVVQPLKNVLALFQTDFKDEGEVKARVPVNCQTVQIAPSALQVSRCDVEGMQ